MKTKAPLRAIKYSSTIWHWVALCNQPPIKLLQKTIEWKAKILLELIIFDLAAGNTDSFMNSSSKQIIDIECTSITNITYFMAALSAQHFDIINKGNDCLMDREHFFSHLPTLCSVNSNLMAKKPLMMITMTSPGWPHGSIAWVNSKLSIKTSSMNPAQPIQPLSRSWMYLVPLAGQ